jgi:hypothetical protein
MTTSPMRSLSFYPIGRGKAVRASSNSSDSEPKTTEPALGPQATPGQTEIALPGTGALPGGALV